MNDLREPTSRIGWIGLCLVLAVTACGGGGLSIADYNTQATALVVEMDERIAVLDAEWDLQPPTVERARSYWERRMRARSDAFDALQLLVPPSSLDEVHAAGIAGFSLFLAAEDALAVRVATYDVATGPEDWWATDEGMAVRAIDAEVASVCEQYQDAYDATEERDVISDVSWLPGDAKEIVDIDVYCGP